MSFNVVVIPEDDLLDKYILYPVFEAVLQHLGRPSARVRVVDNPKPRGIDTVLAGDYAERVLARFPMADVYVYCLDRDGRPDREDALASTLDRARDRLRPNQAAEGVLARQELEVWCLINHFSDLADPWDIVTSDPHPKERYFTPLVHQLLPVPGPGRGRQLLGKQAAQRYELLRQRCPEILELEGLLEPHLA